MTAAEPPASTTRIFLLDDHEIVRRGLAELLNSVDDFEVVGEAGTVAEALRRIPAASPDVAILDGRLPDGARVRASAGPGGDVVLDVTVPAPLAPAAEPVAA